MLGASVLVACSATGDPAAGTDGEDTCAPPLITVEPRAVAAGDDVVVTGRDFAPSGGCRDEDGGALAAGTDLTVVFEQGGRTTELGSVTIGADGSFETAATIPVRADLGRAAVRVDGAERVRLHISP
ncbi:hypothetical protein GCM10025865_10030 [Paraoerskovia sediminicola]|uniref:IPT/TIG domain-containing protein n=1 Tax=Paraoerskovia sediminicola TaxID=1138587 RepID=A0ABN6XA63_9CELL|nr:hypothetical protein GCM10025865_10030 [Paraoerskovia sediminicola]